MEVVLKLCEEVIYKPYVYPSNFSLKEGSLLREILGLAILINIGGYVSYFLAAGLNYVFIFDKRLKKHPLFLKNQVQREIALAFKSIPIMSSLTVPFFLLEIRGFSRLHNDTSLWSNLFGVVSFILFTDCLVYWIHRGLHSKWGYKKLHKTHHIWKVPTPFASHAIHPVDGFIQSFPYHLYVFLFPMNKYVYLFMFVMINFWSVSIHDGHFQVPYHLRPFINGSAHHTDHHLFYNYNYGQFFTLWDRIGGSFRHPSAFQNDSPLDQILKGKSCKK